MNKTVFVTGASGFLGTNIVDTLLDKGYNVVGYSLNYPFRKSNIQQFGHPNYTTIEGNISDFKTLKNTVNKINPNIVIHLAAQAIVGESLKNPPETFETNIQGTWNLMESLRDLPNLERIIIASSDKAYGEHEKLPYQEDYELKAIHPYDISKKITEEIARSYEATYQLPITITRCGNIFGPFDLQFSRIVPETILSCMQQHPIIIRSDGQQERDYVYVKDVVEAYMAIITAPESMIRGQIFNISNGKILTVIELVKLICAELDINESQIQIQNTSKYEIKRQFLDLSKIRNDLNWQPQYTIESALKETINWYKKYLFDLKND
jgi:CDP-glucose 4,6-dehydratase